MTELLARSRIAARPRRRRGDPSQPEPSAPDALFWHLAARDGPRHRNALREIFGPMTRFFATLLVAAPVLEERGLFQLHPCPADSPNTAMRWIFAVRGGYGSPAHTSLFGDIVDLVAVDRGMERPTSRLVGFAPVLGYPQEPSFAETPVRVFASVFGWIAGGFDGVVLIGDRAEQQNYLRACTTGIVADDLPHAEALRIKLRREVPELPKLFVADAR